MRALVGCVEHGDGHDVDVGRIQGIDHVVEPSHLVLGVDHELTKHFPAGIAEGDSFSAGT